MEDDMTGAAHAPPHGVGISPPHGPPPGTAGHRQDAPPGYYNDLLNRVDTVTQGRSAYGGEHAVAEDDARRHAWSAAASAPQSPDEPLDRRAHVLWGEEGGPLDVEARCCVVGVFVLSALAIAFELAQDKLHWFLQWFLGTLICHALAVVFRFGLERLEPAPGGSDLDALVAMLTSLNRRSASGAVLVALFIWAVVDMATFADADVDQGFRVWICVVTVGAVAVEASARLYVRFVDPRLPPDLRMAAFSSVMSSHSAGTGGGDADDLQYAAL